MMLMSLSSFSQINKNNVEFTIDGGGYKTGTSDGTGWITSNSLTKSANIGLSVDYYVGKNISLRVALRYFREDKEINNTLIVDSFYQESNSNQLSIT